MRTQKCCICGKKFKEEGNNPEPVKSEGVCCDECNMTIVMPERVYRWTKKKFKLGGKK